MVAVTYETELVIVPAQKYVWFGFYSMRGHFRHSISQSVIFKVSQTPVFKIQIRIGLILKVVSD